MFVSNELNSVLKIGVISQFDDELNSRQGNNRDQDLGCGPASVAMLVSGEFGEPTSVTNVFADGIDHAKNIGWNVNSLYSGGYTWCVNNGTTVS